MLTRQLKFADILAAAILRDGMAEQMHLIAELTTLTQHPEA
jgi:hypothetical protein